jgi:glutamine synthetase
VYSFDHEDAVGQFEVDFAFCEAGELADRFVRAARHAAPT